MPIDAKNQMVLGSRLIAILTDIQTVKRHCLNMVSDELQSENTYP